MCVSGETSQPVPGCIASKWPSSLLESMRKQHPLLAISDLFDGAARAAFIVSRMFARADPVQRLSCQHTDDQHRDMPSSSNSADVRVSISSGQAASIWRQRASEDSRGNRRPAVISNMICFRGAVTCGADYKVLRPSDQCSEIEFYLTQGSGSSTFRNLSS